MTDKHTEFEQILNRSFDLAVQYQHEYVTLEHLLKACVEQASFKKILQDLAVDHTQLLDKLNEFLADTHRHALMPDVRFQPKYTSTVLLTVKQAKAQSMFLGKQNLDAWDVVMAMFGNQQSWAVHYLQIHNITKQRLQNWSQEQHAAQAEQPMDESDALQVIQQFATNLNKRASSHKLTPMIGRQSDVDNMIHVLCRKTKNNLILVGEPGVGKTQIVEGLAQQIVQKTCAKDMWNLEIWSLDVNSLVAGTKFRGDFEDRMKNLVQALKSVPRIILFVDEIHMIMGAGSGGGQSSLDVANILKPALGRGELRCIGATTQEEFRKHFEKDRALMRRFQRQDVSEPSLSEAEQIIQGVLHTFEKFHGVSYDAACVSQSVQLSHMHMHNKQLPDKALDLIDAAGTKVKLRSDKHVHVTDIKQVLCEMARIHPDTLEAHKTDHVAELQNNLKARLFGQDHVITPVCEHVWMSLSGLREHTKSQGSFLFCGPSGTGKTELAKQLAEQLHYKFVRFDMSEFQEKHSLSRLIGSPPGYVGYTDGGAGSGALINALEANPQCVCLIDEVEKAHPDISQLFLQAMDAGILTGANQKSVSLQNVILIFTSNLGVREMQKTPLGFGISDPDPGHTESDAVKQFFAPEFRNRLDAVLTFNPLNKQSMQLVLNKFLQELNRMCDQKNVTITVNPDAQQWLIRKGFDPHMGARPLSRCIDQHIKRELSKEILFGKLTQGGTVLVSVDDADKLKLDYLQAPVADSGVLREQDILTLDTQS